MIAAMLPKLQNNKIRVGISIILAFGLGWFTHEYLESKGVLASNRAVPIREDSGDYKYINPFLVLDNATETFPELDLLKKSVGNYIESAINDGKAEKISFYFREANTSKWTGIDEDETYAPSSMLKVAVVMVYLQLAEDDPDLLSQNIYYQHKDNLGQYYKPQFLKDGYYSVLTLLQQMIINSDNDIAPLLTAGYEDDVLNFYRNLKLPDKAKVGEDFMSAKLYSRIFRLLYNSTYLSRSYSEQVLKLLTSTTFEKGLRQGVPEDVEIAHKFGESGLYKDGEWQYHELHDCGIVYYLEDPYFICVMTKGSDFSNLEKVIGDISKITFEYRQSKEEL